MSKRTDKNKKRIGALNRLKKWLEYDKKRRVDTSRIEQEIRTLESLIKK